MDAASLRSADLCNLTSSTKFEARSFLKTRSLYHKDYDTILAHVFCSFPTLVRRKELETRLESRGEKLE